MSLVARDRVSGVTLLTGGLGYIGSHVAEAIVAGGGSVVIADDASTGLPERVDGAPLLRVDLADSSHVDSLAQFMREHGVTSVVHLAGRKSAPESVLRPAWYFQQNVGALASVLEAMDHAGVGHLVFSSSAAIYGPTAGEALTEAHPIAPANPYGATKAACEELIRAAAAQGLRATSLRYFNVVGASSELRAEHNGSNLIPRVLSALSVGGVAEVFGDKHPTADGTCIRDYVHVLDLAHAHVRALVAAIGQGALAPAYNIGSGLGYSVTQVLDELGTVLGRPVPRVVSPARPGDPADVVAAVGLAQVDLGWSAQLDLTAMLSDAVEYGPAAWRSLRATGAHPRG